MTATYHNLLNINLIDPASQPLLAVPPQPQPMSSHTAPPNQVVSSKRLQDLLDKFQTETAVDKCISLAFLDQYAEFLKEAKTIWSAYEGQKKLPFAYQQLLDLGHNIIATTKTALANTTYQEENIRAIIPEIGEIIKIIVSGQRPNLFRLFESSSPYLPPKFSDNINQLLSEAKTEYDQYVSEQWRQIGLAIDAFNQHPHSYRDAIEALKGQTQPTSFLGRGIWHIRRWLNPRPQLTPSSVPLSKRLQFWKKAETPPPKPSPSLVQLLEKLQLFGPSYLKKLKMNYDKINESVTKRAAAASLAHDPLHRPFTPQDKYLFFQSLYTTFDDLLIDAGNKLEVKDEIYSRQLLIHYDYELRITAQYQRHQFYRHYLATVYGSTAYSEQAPEFFRQLRAYHTTRDKYLTAYLENTDKQAIHDLAQKCEETKKKILTHWEILKFEYYSRIPSKVNPQKKVADELQVLLTEFLDTTRIPTFENSWAQLERDLPLSITYPGKLEFDLRRIREEQQAVRETTNRALKTIKIPLHHFAYEMAADRQIENVEKTQSPTSGKEDVLDDVQQHGAWEKLFCYRTRSIEAETNTNPYPNSNFVISPYADDNKQKTRKTKSRTKKISWWIACVAGFAEGAVAAGAIFTLCSTGTISLPIIIGITIAVGLAGWICNHFLLLRDTENTLNEFFIFSKYEYKTESGEIKSGKTSRIMLDKNKKPISPALLAFSLSFSCLSLGVGICYGILAFNNLRILILSFGAVPLGAIAAIATIPSLVAAIGLASILANVIIDFIKNKRWIGIASYFHETYSNFPMSELSRADKLRVVLHWINSLAKLVLALAVTTLFSIFTFGLMQTSVVDFLHGVCKFNNTPSVVAAMVVNIANTITWVPLNVESMTEVFTNLFSFSILIKLPLTLTLIVPLASKLFLGNSTAWTKPINDFSKFLSLTKTFSNLDRSIKSIGDECSRNQPVTTNTGNQAPISARQRHEKTVSWRETGIAGSAIPNGAAQGALVYNNITKAVGQMPQSVAKILGPIICGMQSIVLNCLAGRKEMRSDLIGTDETAPETHKKILTELERKLPSFHDPDDDNTRETSQDRPASVTPTSTPTTKRHRIKRTISAPLQPLLTTPFMSLRSDSPERYRKKGTRKPVSVILNNRAEFTSSDTDNGNRSTKPTQAIGTGANVSGMFRRRIVNRPIQEPLMQSTTTSPSTTTPPSTTTAPPSHHLETEPLIGGLNFISMPTA